MLKLVLVDFVTGIHMCQSAQSHTHTHMVHTRTHTHIHIHTHTHIQGPLHKPLLSLVKAMGSFSLMTQGVPGMSPVSWIASPPVLRVTTAGILKMPESYANVRMYVSQCVTKHIIF